MLGYREEVLGYWAIGGGGDIVLIMALPIFFGPGAGAICPYIPICIYS